MTFVSVFVRYLGRSIRYRISFWRRLSVLGLGLGVGFSIVDDSDR